MRWLLPYFTPRAGPLARAEALALLGTGLSLGASWMAAQALDVALPAADRAGLLIGAGGYAVATILAGVCAWAARVRLEGLAQDVMRAVRRRAFAHLLELDAAFHDRNPPARLVARLGGDTDALRTLLAEVVLQAPADALLFVGLLGILAVRSPAMAAVVAGTVPLYLVGTLWFRRVSPPRFTRAREAAARLAGLVTELVRALPLVRAYGREDWLRERVDARAADKQEADVAAGMAGVWFFNALFAVRALAFAAIVAVGALGLARGSLTVGTVVLALDYARKLFEPFMRLQFHVVTLERARAGADRLRAMLNAEPAVRSPADPRPWPGPARVALEDVRFAYAPLDDDGPTATVLHGVTLHADPGEHVAIVGPTGSGKSTLVALLLRFRDPDAGRVTVGGVDVRALDPTVLRRRVGLVAQQVHLLPGTVAENLGTDAAGATALLDAVGLGARLTPDARVGDADDAALSRGEAQLLCVARAIAEAPDVLVLDEATASMDPETEARVTALLRARPGRARITVAHRLRTVMDADRIYVMDAGIVVGHGSHAELLAAGGLYATLWRAQLAAAGEAA